MKSEAERCLEAIRKGWHTIAEIAVYAHLDIQRAANVLTRLKNRGRVEHHPVRFTIPKEDK